MYSSIQSPFEFPIHPPSVFPSSSFPPLDHRLHQNATSQHDLFTPMLTNNDINAPYPLTTKSTLKNTSRSNVSSTLTSTVSRTPRSSPARNKEHIVRSSKDRYHTAAQIGFLPLLQEASRADASRERGVDRCTPLMCAAGAGHLDALQILAATGFAVPRISH